MAPVELPLEMPGITTRPFSQQTDLQWKMSALKIFILNLVCHQQHSYKFNKDQIKIAFHMICGKVDHWIIT